MEISLLNIKYCLETDNFYSVVKALLCLLFLKNNQSEIILMLKKHILGWWILPPTPTPVHCEMLRDHFPSLSEYLSYGQTLSSTQQPLFTLPLLAEP